MKVVIDTNVLMAALLKNSIVRVILNFADVDFYIPEKGIEEVRKYSEELCLKGGFTHEEFENLLSYNLENIRTISHEELKGYMGKAEKIIGNVDIKDAVFVAAALTISADGIWSFDNDFKKQNIIKIFDSSDFLKIEEE